MDFHTYAVITYCTFKQPFSNSVLAIEMFSDFNFNFMYSFSMSWHNKNPVLQFGLVQNRYCYYQYNNYHSLTILFITATSSHAAAGSTNHNPTAWDSHTNDLSYITASDPSQLPQPQGTTTTEYITKTESFYWYRY